MPPLILATPFRSFFLLAGLMATLWIPGWIAVLRGELVVLSDLGVIGWHAHEMLFGYTAAVLAGFLLTAAGNWTKHVTLSGWAVGALVLLWCIGRGVALRSADLPMWLAPSVDVAFFAVLAAAIARVVIKAKSKRNAAFPVLLLGLGLADLAVHLAAAGYVDPTWQPRGQRLAIDLIAVIIILFAGRVVPLFTRNALAKSGCEIRSRPRGPLDWAGLLAVWAVAGLDLVLYGHALGYIAALLAGVLNLARLWGWGGTKTAGQPLVWVLHLAWIMVSLSLLAFGVAGLWAWLPASAAIHLFTVGGIGTFTLGMMARVSLGHTGRPMAASLTVALAFALIVAATVARVLPPSLMPDHYLLGLYVSASAWSIGFALFTVRYVPVFLSARADGKPG